jgi:hypothetical protein
MAAVCSSPAETVFRVIGGSKTGVTAVDASSEEQPAKSKTNHKESIKVSFS